MSEHTHQIADEQERMKALLANISAYIEQYHGGSVEMISFTENTLKVKLGGACEGCALTETTLQGWIAGTVRQFFPEIKAIEAV